MYKLELDADEGLYLQTTSVTRFANEDDEDEILEMILTNKNIICVIESSTGAFSASKPVVEKIPLSNIKVANGKVQVMKLDNSDFGRVIQILYVDGRREYFSLDKKEMPVWIEAIIKAVKGEEIEDNEPVITKNVRRGVSKEKAVEKIKEFGEEGTSKLDKITRSFEESVTNVQEKINEYTRKVEGFQQETACSNTEEVEIAYCIKCGTQLNAGAQFCHKCGMAVGKQEFSHKNDKNNGFDYSAQQDYTERKVVYEGKIIKCPHCGETLKSFSVNCPSCGNELRGKNSVSSVHELAAKLEAIEAGRETRGASAYKDLLFGKPITKTDDQKISLIKSFSIPNTKEDLYEFLILAGSNINADMYDSGTIRPTDVRVAISDAWKSKYEQAYQKAQLMFEGDPRLSEIQKTYEKTHRSINKSKTKTWRMLGITFAIMFVVLVVEFVWIGSIIGDNENEEKERLEAIVEDIEEALDQQEYKLALMYADSLQCNPDYLDDAAERQWNIQREYWIDKVIEEAGKKGIILDRPDNNTEGTQKESEVNSQESRQDPFSKGFDDAMSEAEEDIQSNIDQFWDNLNGN